MIHMAAGGQRGSDTTELAQPRQWGHRLGRPGELATVERTTFDPHMETVLSAPQARFRLGKDVMRSLVRFQ
jgi:hypothetical protein